MKRPAAAFLVVCTLSGVPHADGDDWLGPDKALHFTASALITGAGYGISAPFFMTTRVPRS